MPRSKRRRPRAKSEAGEARSQSQIAPASATPPVSDDASDVALPRQRYRFSIDVEFFGRPGEAPQDLELIEQRLEVLLKSDIVGLDDPDGPPTTVQVTRSSVGVVP